MEADEEETENRIGKDNDFMLRNMETKGGSQDSESVTIGIRRVVVRASSCLRIREIDRWQVGLHRRDV